MALAEVQRKCCARKQTSHSIVQRTNLMKDSAELGLPSLEQQRHLTKRVQELVLDLLGKAVILVLRWLMSATRETQATAWLDV